MIILNQAGIFNLVRSDGERRHLNAPFYFPYPITIKAIKEFNPVKMPTQPSKNQYDRIDYRTRDVEAWKNKVWKYLFDEANKFLHDCKSVRIYDQYNDETAIGGVYG